VPGSYISSPRGSSSRQTPGHRPIIGASGLPLKGTPGSVLELKKKKSISVRDYMRYSDAKR